MRKDPSRQGNSPEIKFNPVQSWVREMLLYLADRIQHLKEIILPAIEDGKMVLSDRFHDSTVAYQGFGRGVDLSLIQSIEENIIKPHAPDLTFLFRIDPGVSMKRIDDQRSSADQRDRLEKEPLEFFHRISDGYEQLVQSSPQRFVCLDATASRRQIHGLRGQIHGLMKAIHPARQEISRKIEFLAAY